MIKLWVRGNHGRTTSQPLPLMTLSRTDLARKWIVINHQPSNDLLMLDEAGGPHIMGQLRTETSDKPIPLAVVQGVLAIMSCVHYP